jgi:dihydropteroate synthase
MLELGRPGRLLVMATGLTDLDGVHAAAAEGADLVHVADPALIAAIRAAHPDLGVSVAVSSASAAESGAGLICALPEVDGALAAGVDPARILVELGPGPDFARRLTDLVATGWPVLVADPARSGPAAENTAAGDPAGALAATAIAAWLGARVFGTRHVRATRRVLTMVAAIRGDIPPANATRGLA